MVWVFPISEILVRHYAQDGFCYRKKEPHRPWSALSIQVPFQVQKLCSMAIISDVGNGENTLFWTDRWLHGHCIKDLASRLFAVIPQRKRKLRTVQQALTNRTWVSDIQGAFTVGVIVEYFQLWVLLYDFQLRTLTFGTYQIVDSTPPNPHMIAYSWGKFFLDHGKEFGKLGRQLNANSSYCL